MNVSIHCPACEGHSPLPTPIPALWPCPACGFDLSATPPSPADAATLAHCRVCGHDELFVQKDFPHWLGLSILIGAVVASFVTYSYHEIAWTWAILLGSAAFDGLLYYLVGDVTVCYRCLAQHRGFPANPETKPFDLGVGEKHRQERLRRKPAVPAGENRPQ